MSFLFIMKEFFKIKTGNFRFKVISDTHTVRSDYNPKLHVPHKIMQTKPLRFCVKYCFNVILCQKMAFELDYIDLPQIMADINPSHIFRSIALLKNHKDFEIYDLPYLTP